MLGNKSVIGKYISILVMLIEFANIDSGCPSLRLPNGRVQIRNNVVEFKCRKSYQLVGSKHAYCLNGKWDSNLPICISKSFQLFCFFPFFFLFPFIIILFLLLQRSNEAVKWRCLTNPLTFLFFFPLEPL